MAAMTAVVPGAMAGSGAVSGGDVVGTGAEVARGSAGAVSVGDEAARGSGALAAVSVRGGAKGLGRAAGGRGAEARGASEGGAGVDLEAPWEALDRAARAAWQRGDLDAARALFAALVASEAERGRIELAFGDLMVLARQAGDAAELRATRRAYLRRFPRGIYADDAEAGLCRAEATTECWQGYLERWPGGAHADEARRALGER